MIELREFIADDYMTIQRRHFDSFTYLNFPNPRRVAEHLALGPGFTMVDNEEIIASGGIMPCWKGVGEAWAITSPRLPSYSFAFARTIWRKLFLLIDTMQLERVATVVDAEHTVSQTWVERMGFKREGLMIKYLGGRDYIRYALIKET